MLGSDTMEPQHIDRLVYSRAVLDEAMRLYPPAPFLSRAAMPMMQIGDLRIEAGTLVTIAPYVLHRHQTLWDEPDSFRPERFLPESAGPITDLRICHSAPDRGSVSAQVSPCRRR